MATITLNGHPVHTCGELPLPGQATPRFTLTRTDLSEITSVDLEGKRVVLSIFPSLDTSTCAESVRKFNHLTTDLADTVMLCVSMDLPFAQAQFCGAQKLNRVATGSAFRHLDFGRRMLPRYALTVGDQEAARRAMARTLQLAEEAIDSARAAKGTPAAPAEPAGNGR